MTGLKYRWKISPKKSYSCSLIAAPQVSDAHLNCAPEPSAEHEFGQDGGLADGDVLGRGEQGEHLLPGRELAQVRQQSRQFGGQGDVAGLFDVESKLPVPIHGGGGTAATRCQTSLLKTRIWARAEQPAHLRH